MTNGMIVEPESVVALGLALIPKAYHSKGCEPGRRELEFWRWCQLWAVVTSASAGGGFNVKTAIAGI